MWDFRGRRPLTTRVGPDKRTVRLLARHEQPIQEHVHVRPAAEDRCRHPLLALGEDELPDPTLAVHVAAAVRLIPVRNLQPVLDVGPHVVPDAFGPGDLVGPDPVEELILLPEREAVRVDPGAVDAPERPVQVVLAVLTALYEGHVAEGRESPRPRRPGVPGQDPDCITPALGQGCCQC